MSVHTINEAERTRDANSLRGRPLDPRLRRAELIGGGAYLAFAVALAAIAGVPGFSPGMAAIYVLAIAFACNVRFDVGSGFTVPTQAVFVPMLFALPPSLVPLLVPLGLGLGMTVDVIRGQISASWLITAAGNSWFALGPALVLIVTGDTDPAGQVDVLFAALAAQFSFDFVAAALRDRLFDGNLSLAALGGEVAPIYATDVALSALGLALALAASRGFGVWPVILVGPLFLVLRVFSRERGERLQQLAELNDAYHGTALLLGDVVEADDSYTGEHSKSVVRLALEVADVLGLDLDQRRNVEFGALLHDVGKLAVPNEIVNKPGKLTEREWAVMETHTIEGERMLAQIGGFMAEIGRIVRASHEEWDGSGYPDGLAGERIPVEARVVAACDAFNAMTTTRSYRRAMSSAEAEAELQRCAGSQFDPVVVAALLRVLARSEWGATGPAPAGDRRALGEPQLPGPLFSSAGEGELGCPARDGWRGSARTEELERSLGELAVRFGANVQPGQLVEVSGEVGQLGLVRAIVAAAYRQGASYVDVQIVDPVARWERLAAAPSEKFDHVPDWARGRVADLAARGGASILVAGPTTPGLFDGFDPADVARTDVGPSAEWRDAARTINWTIVPGPNDGWASRLRPRLARDEALAALWADLAHVLRLDEPDPVDAWRERLAELRSRADWLTGLELREVHLAGPGTDLRVGLHRGARWSQAEMESAAGVAYLPNLPTEEVFTSPDPSRVEGRVSLTRPLALAGTLIERAELRFEAGRVVAVEGSPGVDALRQFVARDPGAARLGELALVDAGGRVAALGQSFDEVLLDENAASHVALGYGFPVLLPPTSRDGANSSDHHLDLMVGSGEVAITGVDGAGERHELMRDGRWASTAPRPLVGLGSPG